MAILPLIVGGDAVGILALYSDDAEFFDAEEMILLQELAGDIAFAIDYIAKVEKLSYLAYFDPLTGLANRTLFRQRLEQNVLIACEQHRKLALIVIDVERFKTINDTLGWQAGDSVLKELAARLTFFAGDADRFARIDADHFAIFVADLQTEEDLAHRIEERFSQVFAAPVRIADADLRISAKIGIAMYPADGAEADSLFKNAQAALKIAKAGGERYVFYARTMNERIADKLALENELRHAIDREEFVLYYQPKVSVATGRLTGAEALIRWNHPRRGLVAPGQFIPMLEETGLILDVGRWALRRAVEDYLGWLAAGRAPVRIAVNVSPLQLRSRAFIEEIQEAIGVDARAAAGLELEITESVIMANVTYSISNLKIIRAMGVTIAIDDFGTGFSSLSYLSKLPIDTLKIDRAFVVDMEVGATGLALVSTIINLAHSLGHKVVAEGVETAEQLRLLRSLGCEEMQGFLFSPAIPREQFADRYLPVVDPCA
jgi:diguanylate cyclase (GGDEF)-like protein